MRISYPAPRLIQFDEEEALIIIGNIVNPGFVERDDAGNGLRLWVETDGRPNSIASRRLALLDFQLLLGILRAYWDDGGQLYAELLGGLGEGSTRDTDGNQYVRVAGIRGHTRELDDLRRFAERANTILRTSQNLVNAFTLFGRADRNSADFYMIHEYAEHEFVRFGSNRVDGVYRRLGITSDDQKLLKDSANNLAPLVGGRHVRQNRASPWDLDQQQTFISDLLTKWVEVTSQQETRDG